MRKTVVIDCFPESVEAYRNGYVIVAVDADFLSHTGGPFHLRYAREFAERRRPESAPNGMNRLYAIESDLSVTGALVASGSAVDHIFGGAALRPDGAVRPQAHSFRPTPR